MMSFITRNNAIAICALFALMLFLSGSIGMHGQTVSGGEQISTKDFNREITEFASKEIAAHFADIKSMNPPPDRVFNAITTGEFSWGSFARTLAADADFSGDRTVAGKDTARAVAEMGLYESRRGGKSFAQLYSTLALRHYGTDLNKNAVWQSMNDAERKEWYSLLDPSRFYDAKKRVVINLPENYLGVAARVAAMSYQLGVLKDRTFLDSVVEKAAEQFTKGAIYSDDNPPTGRYDRYSNEYARFCWDAAEIAGREDIKNNLKASIKRQMELWWDLVSPAGYGYNWGRSQGLVSYLDTLEIVAFLAAHKELRPAPLPHLAAVYYQAWRWLRADFNNDTHLFRVFDYGRGNYSYINPTREWQQTTVGLGKAIVANNQFMKAMEAENVERFPTSPTLPDVSRFEYFYKSADRQNGVWLVRQGRMQFALPIVAGTKSAISDYLPAPFGLPGFAAPVEEVYPSMVPFITLADGASYAAADGADEIKPSADARSLEIVSAKWARIDGKVGDRVDVGLTSKVNWVLSGNILIRSEEMIADRDTQIKAWRFALPTTASSVIEQNVAKHSYQLKGREGTLNVTVDAPESAKFAIVATGNSKLGKGVLGAIPIHINVTMGALELKKGSRLNWKLTLALEN